MAQPRPLGRLAPEQRDAFQILVDAHQRETQLRLARVAFGIKADQRPAHQPARQRGDVGVKQRAPDHEARRRNHHVADAKEHAAGQFPQHADERGQQQRGLQQPDPEVRGQFGQLLRVGRDALVWVFADAAGVRQPERALGQQPFSQKIVHQALAQQQFRHLAQPGLRHVQRQEHQREPGKDPELLDKGWQVAAGQRVVKGLVPGIQPDLEPRGGADHSHDAQCKRQKPVALSRGPECLAHGCKLGPQRWCINIPRGCARSCLGFCHLPARASILVFLCGRFRPSCKVELSRNLHGFQTRRRSLFTPHRTWPGNPAQWPRGLRGAVAGLPGLREKCRAIARLWRCPNRATAEA